MIFVMNEAGQQHGFAPDSCEDACAFRESGDFLVLTAADGVSACMLAKNGARIAAETAADYLIGYAASLAAHPAKQAGAAVLSAVQNALYEQARREQAQTESYSSTLAAILHDRRSGRMLCLNLGDSLILGADADGCRLLAMPGDSRTGCWTTTSTDAESALFAAYADSSTLQTVLLCTDGAWRLLFAGTRLSAEARQFLTEQNLSALRTALMQRQRFDDCSFIAADAASLQGKDETHEYDSKSR